MSIKLINPYYSVYNKIKAQVGEDHTKQIEYIYNCFNYALIKYSNGSYVVQNLNAFKQIKEAKIPAIQSIIETLKKESLEKPGSETAIKCIKYMYDALYKLTDNKSELGIEPDFELLAKFYQNHLETQKELNKLKEDNSKTQEEITSLTSQLEEQKKHIEDLNKSLDSKPMKMSDKQKAAIAACVICVVLFAIGITCKYTKLGSKLMEYAPKFLKQASKNLPQNSFAEQISSSITSGTMTR